MFLKVSVGIMSIKITLYVLKIKLLCLIQDLQSLKYLHTASKFEKLVLEIKKKKVLILPCRLGYALEPHNKYNSSWLVQNGTSPREMKIYERWKAERKGADEQE